jgi:hypothetical protein
MMGWLADDGVAKGGPACSGAHHRLLVAYRLPCGGPCGALDWFSIDSNQKLDHFHASDTSTHSNEKSNPKALKPLQTPAIVNCQLSIVNCQLSISFVLCTRSLFRSSHSSPAA